MNEAEIADAVERAMTVVRQDQCADGFHTFTSWSDGRNRCTCGAMQQPDYTDPQRVTP